MTTKGDAGVMGIYERVAWAVPAVRGIRGPGDASREDASWIEVIPIINADGKPLCEAVPVQLTYRWTRASLEATATQNICMTRPNIERHACLVDPERERWNVSEADDGGCEKNSRS